MIKAIIFDFDGVIAESNNVKTDGFVKLFQGYSQEVRVAVRRFHLQNGGMSRFDKIRHIYANILKEPLSEKTFNKLCDDFNRFVFDRVMNAPLVEGVKDFLEHNKDKYVMYVVSGTPQDELCIIMKKRRLDKYFSGIYGSPKTKKELIADILKNNKYEPKDVIFLGDSINDYEGAAATDVVFVAKVLDNPEVDMFPGIKLKATVTTIKEFEKHLDEI